MSNLTISLLFILVGTIGIIQTRHSRLLYHINNNDSIRVIDEESHLSLTQDEGVYRSTTFSPSNDLLSSNYPKMFSLLYSTDDYMLVGTYERLLNISLNSLTTSIDQNQISWRSNPIYRKDCEFNSKHSDQKLMYKCGNYIRGVVNSKDTIVVCGTNASLPFCQRYLNGKLTDEFQQPQLNSLTRITSNNYMDVDETAPFVHEDSVYFVNSGSYTIEPTINKLSNWDISVSSPFSKLIKTPKGALKNAKFRASFANGDKVYFFFYETESVMDYKSGLTFKTQYSLIGEVCANDSGKPSYLENFNRFITFKKASIYCYLPDYKDGFHVKYTEIQAVSEPIRLNEDNDDQVFYAIFTFRRMNSVDSALCQFKMSTVEETMSGYFKSMDHDDRITYKQAPQTCQAYKEMSEASLNKYYQERTQNYNYQMETTVNEPALFAMNGIRFTAITIDRPSARNDFNQVIFIGLDNGRVLKLLTQSVETDKKIYQQPIVVQEYQMFKHGQSVKSLIIKQGKLIAISDETIRSVYLDVACSVDHLTCSSCTSAQDPYCAWSTSQSRCISLLDEKQLLKQDLIRAIQQCTNPSDIQYSIRTVNYKNNFEYGDFTRPQLQAIKLRNQYEQRTQNLVAAIFLTALLTCLLSVGLTCLLINKRSKMTEYLSRHLSISLSSSRSSNSSTTSYNNYKTKNITSTTSKATTIPKPVLQNIYMSCRTFLNTFSRSEHEQVKQHDDTIPTTINTNISTSIECGDQQHSPGSELTQPTKSINDTLSSSNESCCFEEPHSLLPNECRLVSKGLLIQKDDNTRHVQV